MSHWSFHGDENSVHVFWIVAPCTAVAEYQSFGGLCRLHLQGEVNMEAAMSSETLTSFRNTTRRHNSEGLDL